MGPDRHVTRGSAANHLLVMNAVIMAGYTTLGVFGTSLARRGIHSRHLVAAGFALSSTALMLIVLDMPGSYLWWSLYGLGAAANVLTFPVLNEGFAREMSGRTNTTLNLFMFVGSFSAQWGIGIVVDLMRALFAFDEAGGLRVAFAAIVVGNVATYAWFAYGWKRHRPHASAATA